MAEKALSMAEKFIEKEMASREGGHGGSDFYATHFFVQKILGRPQGEWAIGISRSSIRAATKPKKGCTSRLGGVQPFMLFSV